MLLLPSCYKERAAMRICVMSYRKANGDECPTAFYLGGRRLPIVKVLERWSEGAAGYFEVCTEDGRRFVLRQDPPARWELAAVYAATAKRSAPRPLSVLSAVKPAVV
jgi:hypothetical protein